MTLRPQDGWRVGWRENKESGRGIGTRCSPNHRHAGGMPGCACHRHGRASSSRARGFVPKDRVFKTRKNQGPAAGTFTDRSGRPTLGREEKRAGLRSEYRKANAAAQLPPHSVSPVLPCKRAPARPSLAFASRKSPPSLALKCSRAPPPAGPRRPHKYPGSTACSRPP